METLISCHIFTQGNVHMYGYLILKYCFILDEKGGGGGTNGSTYPQPDKNNSNLGK